MATKRSTTPIEVESIKRKMSSTKKTIEFYSGRDSLGNYIRAPENYDSTRVIAYDDEFVVIRDMYPKSQIHYLVLARERQYARQQHPIEALGDEVFLARMRRKVIQVREMVVRELQKERLAGREKEEEKRTKICASLVGDGEKEEEQRREENIGGNDASKERLLVSRSSDSVVEEVASAAAVTDEQRGRDWDREVIAGIHARPSMNHLHVHVLSIDRHSKWMKHRNHYNSFTTRFFIPLEDFPLAKDDVRRFPDGAEAFLKSDLKCWRCGLNFGNRFSSLKKHLAREFEEWKKE
ncbi:hypothetical protein OnM2_019075 [Erysiphe neolycopersici]|uniref:Aprataxin C2HE/C2H2/C2HC zinc finger domain-containing protein n=1 Tax=Erysiphe neolycopersici TaxID=212602 RepID=A0A420I3U6_9PEZI|nr:hypothetical protein OnM2_019075 [Erysiphe neolycopersici]